MGNCPEDCDLSKVHRTDNRTLLLEQINDDFGVIYSYNKKITDPNFAGCLSTRQGSNQGSMIVEKPKLKIKNATKKGYLEAEDGDGIDISSRMESHRGTVQKDKAQTITTMGGENVGVVVKETFPNEVKTLGNYSPSNHNASRIVDVGGGSSYCDGKSWNNNSNNGRK